MNCNEIQEKILLQYSGELSESESKVLLHHLAECESCRQFENNLKSLTSLAHNNMPNNIPSDETINNIQQYAREKSFKRVLIFRKPFIQWAVAAAIIIIAISNWPLIHTMNNKNETNISDMYAVLAIITYPSKIIENNESATIPDMEDLFLEFENDNPDETLSTEATLEGLHSISPQSNNNRELPQRIYG